MRIRVVLDGELVAELDRRAGSRPRGVFAAELIARGLEDERRQENLEAAFGSLPDMAMTEMTIQLLGCVINGVATGFRMVDHGSSAFGLDGADRWVAWAHCRSSNETQVRGR